jgi:hypothetical protein
VPQKLRKDYDKLWVRFTSAKDDAKLVKDLEKLLKKRENVRAGLDRRGVFALYNGNDLAAREKIHEALAANAGKSNRVVLSFRSCGCTRKYARAATLYAQLQTVDSSHPEIETKRQKAMLLATDSLRRVAAHAESENRLTDAENAYRQARLLPRMNRHCMADWRCSRQAKSD